MHIVSIWQTDNDVIKYVSKSTARPRVKADSVGYDEWSWMYESGMMTV